MAWTQEEEELYIGGFNTTEDIIECIKDNIDEGNLDTAKDYLNQLNDYLKPRLAEYTDDEFTEDETPDESEFVDDDGNPISEEEQERANNEQDKINKGEI